MSPIVAVTGANRGIGFAIVRSLAQRGARVVATARSRAACDDAIRRLGELGRDVTMHELDVTVAASRAAFVQSVERTFGRLDVLVNNAGVNVDGDATACTVTETMLAASFATNAAAPLLLVQAMLPLLRRSDRARVVNVSSSMAASASTLTGYPSYRIAKAALNAATQQLATELAEERIAVNAVCPGWVRTDLGGPDAPLSPEQGADSPVWLALDAPQELTGTFVSERVAIPW